MKTERKRLTLSDMVRDAGEGLRELVIERPKAWTAQARARLENIPKTNFDLGCAFADQGKWFDALFRFRVAAYFQPDYPQVQYNIGCCYYRLGKLPQATAALKMALKQQPTHTEALFMLAAINPAMLPEAQRPQRMPAAMVSGFFTSIAPSYDIEEARNKYQGGKLVFDFVKPALAASTPRVLDLGCGTGIVSRPWRASAGAILGVDSTPAMVALAEKASHEGKKLFDQTLIADMASPIPGLAPASADLVLCVNSAQFVGELSGVLKTAANALAPGGLFVLTTEPHHAPGGFGLSATTGRFGHASAYVKQAAATAGLTLAKETKLALYPDVSVAAYLFSKGAH